VWFIDCVINDTVSDPVVVFCFACGCVVLVFILYVCHWKVTDITVLWQRYLSYTVHKYVTTLSDCFYLLCGWMNI